MHRFWKASLILLAVSHFAFADAPEARTVYGISADGKLLRQPTSTPNGSMAWVQVGNREWQAFDVDADDSTVYAVQKNGTIWTLPANTPPTSLEASPLTNVRGTRIRDGRDGYFYLLDERGITRRRKKVADVTAPWSQIGNRPVFDFILDYAGHIFAIEDSKTTTNSRVLRQSVSTGPNVDGYHLVGAPKPFLCLGAFVNGRLYGTSEGKMFVVDANASATTEWEVFEQNGAGFTPIQITAAASGKFYALSDEPRVYVIPENDGARGWLPVGRNGWIDRNDIVVRP